MPLAILLKKSGHIVCGSDRSYDQGKTPSKFKSLISSGISLNAQDGTGITKDVDFLVVSTAIESSIPDVKHAQDLNIAIITRGQLLAQCFNAEKQRVAIAGTSGKSTVTGMVGTILQVLAKDPTVVNGGEITNFKQSPSDNFSGIRKGESGIFVAEMDESDGSIAHYNPTIAILNNIALDHMPLNELKELFGAYLERASQAVILNYDQSKVRELEHRAGANVISYAIDYRDADLIAYDLNPKVDGIEFVAKYQGKSQSVSLSVPGRHNVENALAAMAACIPLGCSLEDAAKALRAFTGIHRRMELIGTEHNITVIDDFGHNPDKISASLQTLKVFDGRLIVMFQPHGFGPLRMMGKEMVDVFSEHLGANDILLMPEAYYAGGTVDRSVTAKHIIQNAVSSGINAHWFEARADIPDFLKQTAEQGDRIVIMGARDDTLHVFAHNVLKLFS